jgi:hypothetical protein
MAGARTYPDGARNEMFYDTAYLARHIAYIPTGYGRHPICIADAPELCQPLVGLSSPGSGGSRLG